MEALFIENTSQAIKDYFYKSHESTIATSTQRSSLQGDSYESSKKRKQNDDTIPLNGKSTRRKQSDKQKDVTRSENTEPKDDNHSLIINGENEKKYSSVEERLPYLAFIIEAKCGKFNSLTISQWNLLECVIIGNKCCTSCTMFYITSCPKLKSIIIGQSSFSSATLDIRGNSFC